jgi:hypothetical protein
MMMLMMVLVVLVAVIQVHEKKHWTSWYTYQHLSCSFQAIRQHLHLPGCASPAHATELEAFDLHR